MDPINGDRFPLIRPVTRSAGTTPTGRRRVPEEPVRGNTPDAEAAKGRNNQGFDLKA